mmetsp:Transcript_50146/g.107928  ORF Transcript_50146/g.107928 Transcript_50146/m.107928 type:complete len:168 (+) Transcript_50146:1332-1835(+)
MASSTEFPCKTCRKVSVMVSWYCFGTCVTWVALSTSRANVHTSCAISPRPRQAVFPKAPRGKNTVESANITNLNKCPILCGEELRNQECCEQGATPKGGDGCGGGAQLSLFGLREEQPHTHKHSGRKDKLTPSDSCGIPELYHNHRTNVARPEQSRNIDCPRSINTA